MLFARNDDDGPDWQKVACALAARSRFAVVTGGPGTGKTTTVVKLLALLQHLALAGADGRVRPLRIRLAAPTGKAAARLNESIAERGAIACRSRQLGAAGAAARGHPDRGHNRASPAGQLRRLAALPPRRAPPAAAGRAGARRSVDGRPGDDGRAWWPRCRAHARLVLLGDKDQLASVEAGAVLGELCRRADDGPLPAGDGATGCEEATGEVVPAKLVDAAGEPLDQAVVKLRRSHRFDAKSGIGRLAEAVNAGDVARVRQSARAAGSSGVGLARRCAGDAALRPLVLDGGAERRPRRGCAITWRSCARTGRRQMRTRPPSTPGRARVLAAYARFQLLCAVRRGPHGVERMNERVAQLLHARRPDRADARLVRRAPGDGHAQRLSAWA